MLRRSVLAAPKKSFHLFWGTKVPTRVAAKLSPIRALSTNTTQSGNQQPTVHPEQNHLRIEWPQPLLPAGGSTSQTSLFHYVWLRDNCPCPLCIHPSTRQKLMSSAHVPSSIQPKSIHLDKDGSKLRIEWLQRIDSEPRPNPGSSKGHESTFDLSWLRSQTYSDPAMVARRKLDCARVRPWKSAQVGPAPDLWLDYAHVMNDDHTFHRLLRQMEQYGLVFVRGVPQKDRQVEELALRFGPIRETFYGRSWDVKSVPNAKNIAYTSLFLDLHMDLLYFEAPPGLQFLHCLEASVTGGESIFIDSFKVAQLLKQQDPKAYEILRQVPVTYHYRNNGHIMLSRKPVIIDNGHTEPLQTFFSPPFQGPLDACPVELVPAFYDAFRKWNELVMQPDMLFEYKLEPGECVIFANRRVLHGRREFDQSVGVRHLKGTYVDWDVFRDCLAVQEAKFGGAPRV